MAGLELLIEREKLRRLDPDHEIAILRIKWLRDRIGRSVRVVLKMHWQRVSIAHLTIINRQAENLGGLAKRCMRAGDFPESWGLKPFSGNFESGFHVLLRGACVQTVPPLVELITKRDRAEIRHTVLTGGVGFYTGCNGLETLIHLNRAANWSK